MTVAPAKLVTRREGTREVPPSRKREELTGRALEGYWLLAPGILCPSSRRASLQLQLLPLHQARLSRRSSSSPSPHRHYIYTSHHCTALHFTALPAATSPPPVPPLYRPTYRRYLLFPTARPRPIARLAFARYQHPDPHYGSNFVSAGIAPHHEEPAVILEAASSITIELSNNRLSLHTVSRPSPRLLASSSSSALYSPSRFHHIRNLALRVTPDSDAA